MENPISEDELIATCGKVGKILLTSGAETSRVESTVEYIGKAAHFDISCHATITALFVGTNQQSRTHLVKVRLGDFNLEKVDEINTMSRKFVEGKINFDELKIAINQIDHKVIDFTWSQKIFGAGVVSVAPMLLFKATWADLGLAFFVGIFGYLGAQLAGRRIKTPYVAAGCGGFIVGLLAAALQTVGIATSAGNIIVSASCRSFRELPSPTHFEKSSTATRFPALFGRSMRLSLPGQSVLAWCLAHPFARCWLTRLGAFDASPN